MKLTEEQIEKAKSWDLLSYLQTFEPEELIHKSGKYYTTRTHDSVIIHDGNWTRYSTGEYGSTALSYLTYVMGKPYKDMVLLLAGNLITPLPAKAISTSIPKKELELPQKNKNNNSAIRYLCERGISKNLINICIRHGLIYEEKDTCNVVFVGRNENGQPKYAACRGTGVKRFFREAAGSDKRFSFSIPSQEPSAILNVFESAIDLLSFCTLRNMAGHNCFKENNLSTGGIYSSKKNKGVYKLPLALEQYLATYPNIKNIALYLDNDDKGQKAAMAIMNRLSSTYNVSNHVLKDCKDINDLLISLLKSEKQDKILKEMECPEKY